MIIHVKVDIIESRDCEMSTERASCVSHMPEPYSTYTAVVVRG